MLVMGAPVPTRWKSAALAVSTRFTTVSRFSLALPGGEPTVTGFSALQSNERMSMALGEEAKEASNVSPWIAGSGLNPEKVILLRLGGRRHPKRGDDGNHRADHD